MKLTEQQRNVALANTGNLLVSAAAGSGKTSVMTERIVGRVLTGELDLRRILVMTFTNAAATNMRKKIESRLTEALKAESDKEIRKRILEQLSFLPSAHISTIHAFCLHVIGSFGYDARDEAGTPIVEPGFATLDPTRSTLLLGQAIDDVLGSLYERMHEVLLEDEGEATENIVGTAIPEGATGGPFDLLEENAPEKQWFLSFDRMLASFGSPRSDAPVKDMLLQIYGYLRSMPRYDGWVKEKIRALLASSQDFSSSAAAEILMGEFRTAIRLATEDRILLARLLPAVDFVKASAKNAEYRAYYEAQLTVLDRIFDAENRGELTWDFCVETAASLPTGRGARVGADASGAKADFFAHYASMKEILYYLTGVCSPDRDRARFRTNAKYLFATRTDEIERDLQFMLPVTARFFELLLLVDRRYSLLKREENAIDFSDYEHLALLLLSRPEAGNYYSELFTEIYIDEYQDNSRIQDAIVSCFSRDNCFAVGDVKQSIYRFRHAKPEMFLRRLLTYRKGEEGTAYELNSNFRSVPGILRFINSVFEQILSQASGEIDYDDTQKLCPELPDSDRYGASAPVEMLLLDITPAGREPGGDEAEPEFGESREEERGSVESETEDDSDASDDEDGMDFSSAEKEAYAVIDRLIALRGIYPELAWSSCAVLTRTNIEAAHIAGILRTHGIPAVGAPEAEFLSSRELLLMENLIRLLDNFRQDIPLAAVLRADFPQSHFSDEELLAVSLFSDESGRGMTYFHEKILAFREGAEESLLRKRVAAFLDWIDSLRSKAMYMRVSELIEHIYSETEIRDRLMKEPDAKSRLLSLETFREWAEASESTRRSGLYRFVTYVENIRKQKRNPPEFDLSSTGDAAIACMSIHASKGLEFPIVFLCGIGRKFPSPIAGSRLLLSENLGIGTDYIDPSKGFYYSTHAKIALENEERRASLSEHMRVLYVAMTRAREKLYLIGSFSRRKDGSIASADLVRFARAENAFALPAWLVQKCGSYLDFLLLSFARDPELAEMETLLRDSENASSYFTVPGVTLSVRSFGELMEVSRFDSAANEADMSGEGESSSKEYKEDPKMYRIQAQGVYADEALTKIPAKITVSELKRRLLSADPDAEDSAVESVPGVRPINLIVRPIELDLSSRTRSELSPVERGVLLHSVFQYLDFSSVRGNGRSALRDALRRLVSRGMIREETLPILANYEEAILAFCDSELCARMLAAEKQSGFGPFREIPFSLAPEDEATSMIQGMIDCWFIEDGQAVLVDYKSDLLRGSVEEVSATLRERYDLQLTYYARAITAASGLEVKEKLIWLIPQALSYSF